MELFDFVKSDIGVALAWICTVGSTISAIVMRNKNKDLRLQIKNFRDNIDNSQDKITQHGEKSIYTKNNSGDINIDM